MRVCLLELEELEDSPVPDRTSLPSRSVFLPSSFVGSLLIRCCVRRRSIKDSILGGVDISFVFVDFESHPFRIEVLFRCEIALPLRLVPRVDERKLLIAK